ncbi:hypothetical protein D3C76_1378660 [compost metagenome]
MNALGYADRTITANYPIYAVFNKNGEKTYVAYNMTNTVKTVAFSDGYTLTVQPNSFNSSSSGGGGGTDPIDPNPGTGEGEIVTQDYKAGVTRLSSSAANIYFQPTIPALYVDVHYTVAGGGQLNYRMLNNNGTWNHEVSGLTSEQVIEYWFTYEKSGPQYDSPHYQYTH